VPPDSSPADTARTEVVDATIKRRHLFARYSIVFHSFSVSQRENDGKHIEKRYDKERRNTEP
jgi:hypothetical protein